MRTWERKIDALLSKKMEDKEFHQSWNKQQLSGGSYRGNKRLSYEHAEDICKGDRLSCGLLSPQGLDVVGDVLGKQQPQWVTANSIH